MFWEKLIARRVAAFEEEILQKYYTEVENMYARMRGWRHDYRHHIQAMKVHAAKGEYAEIDRYLDMLDQDLTNVETVVKTGNRMADAILNSKLSLAEQKEIRIKAEARKGNYLYFALTNTAKGEKKHSFRSTKGKGHGLGLSRVDAAVKKYGGYVTRASEDGAFSTEILLPQ